MNRNEKMPWIVPRQDEISPEGFFLGQLVCPEKNHFPRWSWGQVVNFEHGNLSLGPVLNIRDVITGKIYNELPGYVNFLARVNLSIDDNKIPMGVCLLLKEGHIPCHITTWDMSTKKITVTAIKSGRKLTMRNVSGLYKLIRVKALFSKPT